MRFYTNVQMIGNNFLVRGYEDGRKVMFQENITLLSLSNQGRKLSGKHLRVNMLNLLNLGW